MQGGQHLTAGSLIFKNNYAINETAAGMPARDFTVEFWGRTPAVGDGKPPPTLYSEFFSYATRVQQPGVQRLPNTLCRPSHAFELVSGATEAADQSASVLWSML